MVDVKGIETAIKSLKESRVLMVLIQVRMKLMEPKEALEELNKIYEEKK